MRRTRFARVPQYIFWIVTPVLLGGLLYVSSGWWLPLFGTFLVSPEAGEPSKADGVVVLAGDGSGLRVEKGGELVRAGFAPTAFVSGPPHIYGKSEADLAIDWAASRGYSRDYFTPLRVYSTSTEDEAIAIADELRKRGNIHKILLVTSNYHTRRSARLWRNAVHGDFEIRVVAAPDRDVIPDHWWANREGRKKIFFEWIKTVTGPLGV